MAEGGGQALGCVGGGRWAKGGVGGKGGRGAAHLQRSIEGGLLLGRAVVLGAPPGALRHRDVVEEHAHLAAGAVLQLGMLVEDLQYVRDRAQLQPVLVRVVGVEPVAPRAAVGREYSADAAGAEQAELLRGVE